jgi:hypothetical protein
MRMRALLACVMIGVACGPVVAIAEPPKNGTPGEASKSVMPEPRDPHADAAERERLTSEFLREFKAQRFDAAEVIVRALIALDEWDAVARYNLAACLTGQGKLNEAQVALREAVERGFVDFDLMLRDRNLAALRPTPTFRALLAKWGEVQERIIEEKIVRLKPTLARGGRDYTIEKDATSRLAFLNAFPEASYRTGVDEIRRVERFWKEQVLPEGTPLVNVEASRPDPWVLVLLPTPEDYRDWAMGKFGSIQVAGIYDHQAKKLVTKDLGPILRHEFSHVVHWRSMMRSGFVQPIWVQEGLCSLLEDVKVNADGSLSPQPSWRTNLLKRMSQSAKVPKWADLRALSAEKFSESRGLANYAASRGFFLFLYQQGKLREWYSEYLKAGEADPHGDKALEKVFGLPIKEIERRWRAWVSALPDAPDASRSTGVGMPFAVDEAGDGMRIIEAPLGFARLDGLRLGDVLTAINGMPVRDHSEYARALSGQKVGQSVKVSFRRGPGGKVTGEATIVLVEIDQ